MKLKAVEAMELQMILSSTRTDNTKLNLYFLELIKELDSALASLRDLAKPSKEYEEYLVKILSAREEFKDDTSKLSEVETSLKEEYAEYLEKRNDQLSKFVVEAASTSIELDIKPFKLSLDNLNIEDNDPMLKDVLEKLVRLDLIKIIT